MRRTVASAVDLAALTAAFNQVYQGYLVPVRLSEAVMATHLSANAIDLDRSPLWLDDSDEVVGLALLGVRGPIDC